MFSRIPNWLTGLRIAIIPVFVLLLYLPYPEARWWAAGLFVIASITDFLDGWLARKWNVESSFGRFLDPIADKLLVAAALLMLVHTGEANTIPAILIISREILVSGLREYLAELQVPMPVSQLGKWKTAAQMAALILLILGAKGTGLEITEYAGRTLLWIAAALTVYSGYAYLRAGLKHFPS